MVRANIFRYLGGKVAAGGAVINRVVGVLILFGTCHNIAIYVLHLLVKMHCIERKTA